MALRGRITEGLARQLGHPTGFAGRLVGVALNVENRPRVTAAVDALSIPSHGVVADLGFGGGVGIALLLQRVDAGGKVHGVEQSSTMLGSAARRFRDEVATGRLELHRASLTDLPFDAASLDGIVTTNTIYFVADLDQAFREIARTLKRSGEAAIGLGDPEAMRSAPSGFRIRPIPDVVAALERAGLTLSAHHEIGPRSRRFHVLVTSTS